MKTLWCLAVIVVSIGSFFEVIESKPRSSYQDTKVCTGSNTGLHHSHAGKPWDRYLSYVERYGNCTTIQESVEILFLEGDHDYNMSFLESIREVNGYVLIYGNFFDVLPLKNLRLIRGRTLYTPGNSTQSYSLFISTNYKARSPAENIGLKEIHLTSLHEVLNGEILFERNNLLCHAQNINWVDILSGRTVPTFKTLPEGQYQRQCGECHSDCTFNGTGYCWGSGPNLCQRITSLRCAVNCEHRCFGPEPTECCDPQCAGGCGRDKYDCWACRHFSNYGECVNECPGEKIYNVKTYKYEDNPDVRYIYGANCEKECPSHMLIEGTACVAKCSEGSMSGKDRKCKKCDNGICPKSCESPYPYINKFNVDNFIGCTIVEGSLVFAKNGFDPIHSDAVTNMSTLSAFENVKEISGHLIFQADHPELTSMSFLRNLRVIYGRVLRGTVSFSVSGSSLVELGLNSLKEIANGNVFIGSNRQLRKLGLVSLENIGEGSVAITNNEKLCYANTINWTQIITGDKSRITLSRNRDGNQTENCVCSAQCSASDGCWGERDDECRSCAHYRFGQTCVSSCNFQRGLYPETVNDTKECRRCHDQCRDDCTGEGSDKCVTCKNVKDGTYCIAKCPEIKFPSVTGSCEFCYEDCKGGCTGNGTFLGSDGCSDCYLMLDQKDGTNLCLKEDSFCPSNFYTTKYYIDPKNKLKGVDRCSPCHHECRSCQSSGTSLKKDNCECINFIYDDHCVAHCPAAHYSDSNKHCHPCHHECLECYGPTASECLRCKNVRVIDETWPHDYDDSFNETFSDDGNSSYPKTSSLDNGADIYYNSSLSVETLEILKRKFNCTDVCPEWLNHKEKYLIGDHVQFVCMKDPNIGRLINVEKKGTTIVLPMVIGVIILTIAIVIVVFLRRQWAKSEENKLRIAARMNGLDVEEIITPTNAKPDTAILRLIKESDLRRGSEIGSGAFGTVFKGIWIPTGENVKIPVAIKVLTESSNASMNVELLEEARVMASVNHPCCIRILAVCMTAQMMLVTQLMPHGSLLDYLRKNRSSIGSSALLKWSAQIARGMKYLEEKGIVHRDLAARNVLVQGPGQVRITDFGLAKLLNYNEEQYQATGGKMPIKWLALESIQHRIFTHKSDVWSYGVTLWELFTYGDRPYEGIRAVDMAQHLEMGERLSQPQICTIDVYMIMIKCWMVDSESRPTFNELEMEFTNMTKDPGRYLVIQGDRFMRLQSVAENTSPTDWLRALSIPEEEGGPEKLMTADEYLCPQDLLDNFHPLGARFLQNMSSINEDNNYENSCNRPLSVETSSTSSPTEAFTDLEEAAAAKKLKPSSVKGRDRKHSIRYTSDPCRDEINEDATGRTTTSPDIKKAPQPHDMELMCFTDETDYLQPRSSTAMANCPNYLDVVDDADSGVKQFVGNPEYFLQNDANSKSSEKKTWHTKDSKDHQQQQPLIRDSYINMTQPLLNNNYKDARMMTNANNGSAYSTRPTYSNL